MVCVCMLAVTRHRAAHPLLSSPCRPHHQRTHAQGLFHPARKVRQTYWRVYNNLYIGGQDALVAFAPRFPDSQDGANTFTRHELDILL